MRPIIFAYVDDNARDVYRSKDADPPKKAHPDDSCIDLYAVKEIVLEPMKSQLIPLGIKVNTPPGWEAELLPRSSIFKLNASMPNSIGVIDEGYRGELMMPLMAYEELTIEKGQKIAQIRFRRRDEFCFIEGEIVQTERSEGGFGSTGN